MEALLLFESSSIIWKFIIDQDLDLLYIESRDENEREASFSSIALNEGVLLWRDYLLEEEWWLSLQYASSGVLLITVYEDGQNPEAKQLIAIDGKKGEGLWQVSGLFESINQQYILLRDSEQKLLWVDLYSGEIKEAQDIEITTGSKQLIVPHRYLPETSYFETVTAFLTQRISAKVALAIDYLETTNYIVIAYYQQVEIHYEHHLVVFSKNGELLFSELLADKLKGIGNEPFVMHQHWLIYVEGKTRLKALVLD